MVLAGGTRPVRIMRSCLCKIGIVSLDVVDEGVVAQFALVLGQNLVGVVDLLELFVGQVVIALGLVRVEIGVVLLRLAEVGQSYLLLRC